MKAVEGQVAIGARAVARGADGIGSRRVAVSWEIAGEALVEVAALRRWLGASVPRVVRLECRVTRDGSFEAEFVADDGRDGREVEFGDGVDVRWTRDADTDLEHADAWAAGKRVFATTFDGAGRVVYAWASVLAEVGVAGGRYEPPARAEG